MPPLKPKSSMTCINPAWCYVDIAPEERAAAREEHEEALGDYAAHSYNERAATIAEGHESRKDIGREIGKAADRVGEIAGKGLDIATGIVGGVADKAVDILDEVLDLFAGSTKQRTPMHERQEGKKHERTPEAREAKAERTPEPSREPAPKREETAGEMRHRLMEEAAKVLDQERQRDREEGRTRSRSRGR